jgi:hypothetical protein
MRAARLVLWEAVVCDGGAKVSESPSCCLVGRARLRWRWAAFLKPVEHSGMG